MNGGNRADKIIEDAIGDGFGKRANIAEGVEIKFQGFALDADLFWGVADGDGGEVGLTCDGAEGGEFGGGKDNLEGAVGFGVGKGFQSSQGRVGRNGNFATEKGEACHGIVLGQIAVEEKSLGAGIVAVFPGEATPEGLKPGVEGDGENKNLAKGVEDGAEVTLAKAVGEGEAKGENDKNLRPNERAVSGSEEKVEGSEEEENLDQLKRKEGGDVSVKAGVKIFGKALPDFAKAGVHAATDEGDGMPRTGAIKVKDLKAGWAHISGEGDIFHEVMSDRLMPPDLGVGRTTKENKLPVGGTETAERSLGPVREVEKNKQVDEWNDKFFAPALRFEEGPKGEKISFLCMGEGDGLGDCAIGKAGVGIDKKKIIALGLLGELMASPRFSDPVWGQWLARDEADTGVLFCAF